MRLFAVIIMLVSLIAAGVVAMTVDFSRVGDLVGTGVTAQTTPAGRAAGRAPARAGGRDRERAAGRDRERGAGRRADAARRSAEPESADVQETVRRYLPLAAALVGATVALCLLMVALIVAARTASRRRREIVRYELVPFRADEATPEMVRRLLESWHQQLLERVALASARRSAGARAGDDHGGRRAGRTGGAAGDRDAARAGRGRRGLAARLLPELPHAPARRAAAAPGGDRAAEEARPFIMALHVPEEEDPVISDAVLGAMSSIAAPCLVQITLTPTPALFDGYARGRFKAREKKAVRARGWDRTDPGLGSELLARELEAGLAVQHRPLFFADVRIGGPTREACRAIGGAIRGESGGENRLHERHLSKPGRRELYAERIRRAWSNPLPSWRHGVYSSSELAGLWRLPSPGLTTVAVTRSAVPRVDAPPAISRDPGHALLRDERGPVGILSVDKTDGLGLIGGQKTGKTSVLCQTVRVDAEDPDCAVICLMPKPGDARKALSTIPAWRTVHYLDFESPELGINPLLAVGDVAMVADKVVDAFRDVNAEGDIKGSSDRYLRQAAQAAIGASRAGAIEGPPTLWHMYRMLLPGETVFREHVVRAIYGDPRFTDTATFFGRDLPNDLRDATVNTTSKLDAPRNKILRLIVESLDKVLRHPRQLDLDSVVRNREVLIVDGKMGTFGSDNCRVMMQFILNMLYGTLQRQQQLPESERVRVAVKVDEAHLIINDSFADALATLRSAGLEIVAAWQYGEQIQDPKIRAGMMSLLRQRCMFSMGETQDARQMSEVTMAVYTDVIRADREERSRLRIAPDTIINMPNHHAVCSWISHGAREPAFVAQTIPLPEDEAVVTAHLEAQRLRGGFVPDRLPDPLPDVQDEVESDRALALAVGVGAEEAEQEAPAGPVRTPAHELPAMPGDDLPDLALPTAPLNGRDGAGSGNGDGPLPDSYTELDLDEVRGLDWEEVDLVAESERHEPSERELEILAALWRSRALFARQVHRRWWPRSTLRSAQLGLQKMARAGWIRPCRFALRQRGSQQRLYVLTQAGFELAQQRTGRHGAYVDPELEWREPQLNDPRRLLRDLHVNGWVLALEQRAGRSFANWRGPREAKLRPPRRRVRGEWLELRPEDVTVGASRRLDGLAPGPFEAVTPGRPSSCACASPGSRCGSTCWSTSSAAAAAPPARRSCAATTRC